MPRAPRTISPVDIYHAIVRGSGQQLIFEDDRDRALFLKLAGKYIAELEGEVFAWILMTNHVHLILHIALENIDILMRKLGATYCVNFNRRTGRSGHVLQGRFHSEAIDTEEYLMTCIRYVHQNIEKAGCSKMEGYMWSSYSQYSGTCAGTPFLEVNVEMPLAVFGSLEGFLSYHETRDFAVPCIDLEKTGKGMSDEEALIYAKSSIGEEAFHHLKDKPKPERNKLIRMLKLGGISSYQLARLTGIGVNVIKRA